MNDKAPIRKPAALGQPAALSPSDRELAALARALGHPARVAILRTLLRRGDCICGQLVDLLPLAQATVSQHLKVLKNAGLVRGEIDGPRVCYCANPEAVRRASSLLGGLAPVPWAEKEV